MTRLMKRPDGRRYLISNSKQCPDKTVDSFIVDRLKKGWIYVHVEREHMAGDFEQRGEWPRGQVNERHVNRAHDKTARVYTNTSFLIQNAGIHTRRFLRARQGEEKKKAGAWPGARTKNGALFERAQ